MSIVTRVVRIVMLAGALIGAGAAGAQAQSAPSTQGPATTAAQDEYVPIDQLPEGEKLPAAPFLVGAYTVAWAAVLIYVLMLWRRLGRVEQELQSARRASSGR